MASRSRWNDLWNADEFGTLASLLDEIKEPPPPPQPPQPVNALATIMGYGSVFPSVAAALAHRESVVEDVSGEWRRLNKNLLYRRLDKLATFKRALETFRNHRKKGKGDRYGARADFVFLRYLLTATEGYRRRRRDGRNPSLADSDARTQAIKAIRELCLARRSGVRLPDFSDDQKLTDLLVQLETHLASIKRKPREGKKYWESQYLHLFALKNLLAFQTVSETILQAFAEFAQIEVDDSTVRRRLAAARAQWGTWQSVSD